MSLVKNFYRKIMDVDTETNQIINFTRRILDKKNIVMDIGCGYGRILSPLKSAGYQVVGVEKNAHIVDEMSQKGFECIPAEALESWDKPVQMIILSHIIEHFTPTDLFEFLNKCLSKLEKGGYLLIATPLYSSYFYDDFDHIKPYHPAGLQMVFGGNSAQVQYYSPHKMVLKDLWFRRNPLFTTLRKTSYLKTPLTRLAQSMDLLMMILFRLSGGLIGRKDGWVGVFQKC